MITSADGADDGGGCASADESDAADSRTVVHASDGDDANGDGGSGSDSATSGDDDGSAHRSCSLRPQAQ